MQKLYTCVFCFIISVILSTCSFAHENSCQQTKVKPIKNIILMIADGFSPAGATMARYVKGDNLNLDSILVGTVQTKSHNSLITDSAAAATAFATGIKTNNRMIAQHPVTLQNMKTILEAAKEKHMSVGVVVTDDITGATPASFTSHVKDRSLQNDIASQQVNSNVDLLLGGGYKNFLPKSLNGNRNDSLNLLKLAESYGTKVVRDVETLNQLNKLPALGIFAKSELDYTIDRINNIKNTQPSLSEMSKKALELLNKNDNGFILVIEGSRIDHAAHSNDPAAFAKEILNYDETIGLVKNFVDNNPDSLMISVSDHGTGGITVGADVNDKVVYEYKPTELLKIRHSANYLEDYITKDKHSIEKMLATSGLTNLTADEIKSIKYDNKGHKNNAHDAVLQIMRIVSERSRTGWTTVGHSAADVNLYAYGVNSDSFDGNHDNTFIAKQIANLLELNLNSFG